MKSVNNLPRNGLFISAFFLLLIFFFDSLSAPLYAQDEPARYINGPLSPAAVENLSSISAIIFLDDTIVGEPGAVIPRLQNNESPASLFTVLSGRLSQFNTVHWDFYLENFYIHIYSADPTTGYLSGAAPLWSIPLAKPVNSNNVEIDTVADTLSASTLPNLPTYAITNTLTDYKQNRGYYLKFNFTSEASEANQNTTYLAPEIISYMQNNDTVITFYVLSFLPTNGGVRMAAQEIGHEQQLPLAQAVFSSSTQPRWYPTSPSQYSYAIGFEIDGCANDPYKLSEGICGCTVPDDDNDNDGSLNCEEICINDALKNDPGQCGCGIADTDSDSDNTADCNDACANDSAKTSPGACGCGVADTDSDSDSTPDCNDNCANDALKINPGICGCGIADTDSDSDNTADCLDTCSSDPLKTSPGICGCGISDTDSDGDGIADCNDACASDPEKTSPGACGCGTADTDRDNDGVIDCQDQCPEDQDKSAPGQCGCGISDIDTDADGIADCNDTNESKVCSRLKKRLDKQGHKLPKAALKALKKLIKRKCDPRDDDEDEDKNNCKKDKER